jgi:hypothetical protein
MICDANTTDIACTPQFYSHYTQTTEKKAEMARLTLGDYPRPHRGW